MSNKTDIEEDIKYIEDLRELEEELRQQGEYRKANIIDLYIRYNTHCKISKDKIKNKIELYKKLEVGSFDRDSIQADEYRAIISVLQELLDTEKEN